MTHQDQLHRYLFEDYAVRGELVSLQETYRQVLGQHNYPPAVKTLLGELLVATSLLTATLKFTSEITVQLQGDGPLRLAVINGDDRQNMRGLACINGDIADDATLAQMVGNGYLVITLTPAEGERYQGVVGLEGPRLADCLENYFLQSEQLPTRLFIRTGEYQGEVAAAGLLLQVLPGQDAHADDFDHLAQLTATVKGDELFALPANDVLYRLYHQDNVTVYPAQSVQFLCTCSRQRCADALMTLGEQELHDMLEQDGEVDMHCDFCGSHYRFDADAIADLQQQAAQGYSPQA
ncbi:heat shock protein [Sodalis glossinidius str. 'morsitans']|uniref:33 kDa chaperonin n=2 Tax=Sodalis glossinidius (strain morsitans) TaxID=343509 RepID=HSLO_SODGM|nr:Hsp33 family molecular chaperone HslO [Sodalis glossinidius]Q2NQI4.1 RecName: Full=33 kDa chaperonin; AltName: Full=Heat shock protein 33 homolog; Short=HSP33 [Sodalis glossinidius str. 'morsitans']BAE75591.1 heat shock protein [Sodalis glossinidius str. 'morsitans']